MKISAQGSAIIFFIRVCMYSYIFHNARELSWQQSQKKFVRQSSMIA